MSTIITTLNVAFTTFSIVGNEFIKRRNRRGYWFWLVGNSLGLTAFIMQHQWITALLYVYFTVSCVQGLRHWARAEVRPETRQQDQEARRSDKVPLILHFTTGRSVQTRHKMHPE